MSESSRRRGSYKKLRCSCGPSVVRAMCGGQTKWHRRGWVPISCVARGRWLWLVATVGRCVAAEEETLQQMARVPQWQAGFWIPHVGLCLLEVGLWLIDGWAPPFFLSFVFLIKSINWHYVLPAFLQSLRSFCCLLPSSFAGVNPSLVFFR